VINIVAEVVNMVLATMFWLIIGRYALVLISFGRTTFISDIFRRGTDPWFKLVRRLTPAAISDRHVPILGLLLIVNLRLLLAPILALGQ
jgi:hypothetical protein